MRAALLIAGLLLALGQAQAAGLLGIDIPPRQGAAPETEGPEPHRQVSLKTPLEMQDALLARIDALPYATVDGRQTREGRHFRVDGLTSRYIGHMHYRQDGTVHVSLPPDVIDQLSAAGWGEPHPGYPFIFLIYSPRDSAEMDVVFDIVRLSMELARQ